MRTKAGIGSSARKEDVIEIRYKVTIVDSISSVAEDEWNALVPENDPFTRFEFLLALEASGSVSAATGWSTSHMLFRENGELVAAVPLYIKNHSYGEYIFDWSWANASHAAGIPYYPKLTSAVPFTPATGRRVLTGNNSLTQPLSELVFSALKSLSHKLGLSSVHILFASEEEYDIFSNLDDFISRLTYQYHWENIGYTSFDDWLDRFRSRRRKCVKRERAVVGELGVSLSVLNGEQLTESHWSAIEEFYKNTVERKHAHAYLNSEFFSHIGKNFKKNVLAFIAEKDGQCVAMSLCFQRGEHLYGRYWGCLEGYKRLHFEMCFHRPIELCIDNGWVRFEAGAQGEHKISRGLVPSATYSLHWAAHKGLHEAIREATEVEKERAMFDMEILAKHAPFRRG